MSMPEWYEDFVAATADPGILGTIALGVMYSGYRGDLGQHEVYGPARDLVAGRRVPINVLEDARRGWYRITLSFRNEVTRFFDQALVAERAMQDGMPLEDAKAYGFLVANGMVEL